MKRKLQVESEDTSINKKPHREEDITFDSMADDSTHIEDVDNSIW